MQAQSSRTAIDLDRERTVGEILLATVRIYSRYPLLFAVLAVSVIAPYELAKLAVTGWGPLTNRGSASATLIFDLLSFSLVGPLISALHIHAVVEIGEGRRPKLGAVARKGLHVLPVVAAAEIVANLLIGLGFLAFVIPGIILALRWAVVAQTAAVDHEGWLAALRRSRQLTATHYEHIIGLLLVTGVVSLLIDLAARLLFIDAGSGPFFIGHGTSVVWVLVGIAIHTFTASVAALTLALLYFDLRAGEAAPAHVSTPEYQELRDLD